MAVKYGIDIEEAHERAIALAPEDFFWSCVDELTPFGSGVGEQSLAEYREWRDIYPSSPTLKYLQRVIETLGGIPLSEYDEALLDRSKILASIPEEQFDNNYYIDNLDISVIATGFAQLVDEGTIEAANKPFIQRAIDRQTIWAELRQKNWEKAGEYIERLKVLSRILKAA